MVKGYFVSCEECKQWHKQTGLCLLGLETPESLQEAEQMASFSKHGLNCICNSIESSDFLLTILQMEREVNDNLQSRLP